ncbi:MAG: hypothetical protein J6P62_01430 [Bacteroidales bacterium]|nr:hypothetical protein [Bacteroidales bacterium]
MKKYFLSIAALLLGLLAHSQEADDLGNYAEVSVIARLDLNPNFYKDATEFTLGNSSIYTHFTGSASEHFSWTLVNHWFNGYSFLGQDADPWEMFRGIGSTAATNFIDMAYVDLMFGGWTFTLGKQCMATGGHEYDDWDWDVYYPNLNSSLWESLSCYQWGGKVAWTTPSELSTFALQMTTSPFGERPFSSGLWTWSAQWTGEYGWFAPTWSVTALTRNGATTGAPRACDWLVSLGNQFLLDQWTIELDWSNCAGFMKDHTMAGHSIHGKVNFAPSERWNVALQGNFCKSTLDEYFDVNPWWNAGAIAEFFPLKDSDALRLHACAVYDSCYGAFELLVGARYNLTFKLW